MKRFKVQTVGGIIITTFVGSVTHLLMTLLWILPLYPVTYLLRFGVDPKSLLMLYEGVVILGILASGIVSGLCGGYVLKRIVERGTPITEVALWSALLWGAVITAPNLDLVYSEFVKTGVGVSAFSYGALVVADCIAIGLFYGVSKWVTKRA